MTHTVWVIRQIKYNIWPRCCSITCLNRITVVSNLWGPIRERPRNISTNQRSITWIEFLLEWNWHWIFPEISNRIRKGTKMSSFHFSTQLLRLRNLFRVYYKKGLYLIKSSQKWTVHESERAWKWTVHWNFKEANKDGLELRLSMLKYQCNLYFSDRPFSSKEAI